MLIAALATLQHGIVARRQLLAMGIGAGAIQQRLDTGWFHRVHRGVYAVGIPPLTREAHLMAALLAAGDDAALSHLTAAELHGLVGGPTPIHVTCRRSLTGLGGVTRHRKPVPDDEVVVVEGLRTTAVARTLVDLAAVLDDYRPAPFTRSEFERRFLAALVEAGLPAPRVNARVAGLEVDCVWPQERVVVELDGRATHDTARAFERDRARDQRLLAAGFRVVRVTWRQFARERPRVLAALAQTLTHIW